MLTQNTQTKEDKMKGLIFERVKDHHTPTILGWDKIEVIDKVIHSTRTFVTVSGTAPIVHPPERVTEDKTYNTTVTIHDYTLVLKCWNDDGTFDIHQMQEDEFMEDICYGTYTPIF